MLRRLPLACIALLITAAASGCAYGVHDWQPPDPPPADPRDPPEEETFGAELPEGPDPVLKPGVIHSPALQHPPLPQWKPANTRGGSLTTS